MPGTKDASFSERWFADQFAFVEGLPAEAKKAFSFSGGILTCEANSKIYNVGPFEVLSLGELSDRQQETMGRASGDFWTAGSLTFQNIVGDTFRLHNDGANENAVFQVASLFNCLESIPVGSGPESGVTCYCEQSTQGPACAISCPAATVFRTYFLHDPCARGSSAQQVDCLQAVGELVDNATKGYWIMRNGYCMPRVRGSIGKLSRELATNPDLENEVRSRIQVGVHWDTEVSVGTHKVTQVFCSAPPVGMMKGGAKAGEWQGFACTVLDAIYDATLSVATTLAAERGERVTCYLTLVGAGALGCRLEWITDALERALLHHDRDPLDVRLVHYASLPSDMHHLTSLELNRHPNGAGPSIGRSISTIQRQRVQDEADLKAELSKSDAGKVLMLTSTFEAFDLNGDGEIDRREFINSLQKVDDEFFTIETIEKLLAEADADGDGVIHYAEFIRWLCGEDEMILDHMGHLISKP